MAPLSEQQTEHWKVQRKDYEKAVVLMELMKEQCLVSTKEMKKVKTMGY